MSSRAKQSVAPRGDRNAAIEQEGMGTHWQLLDEWARTKYREISEGDNFAHRVIAKHIHQLPKMPPMEEQEVIILLIRHFLDQTTGHASVEDAAVYLARSSWDVRLASYRWIDPDNYAAIEKDELWGDEENDESNTGNPPNTHETIHPVVQKSITQPSGVRNASPIDERYQNMISSEAIYRSPYASSTSYRSPYASSTSYRSPYASSTSYLSPYASSTSYQSPYASSTKGTLYAKQEDRSLACPKEGQNGCYGGSKAEIHASRDSISITGTVARGVCHDEYEKTSGTSKHKPGLMYRPSPGIDADGDDKAGDCANPTSEQNIPSSPQREIRHPAGVKTLDSTATARAPSAEGSSKTAYATEIVALNADMDRSPAILGEIMPEKMKIQYQLPRTKEIKRLYFRQYDNGRSLDWQNYEHVRTLNRWRAQVFRRMFGSTRNMGCKFHEEENQWLIERYLQHQETALRHGEEPDYHTMNWVTITKAFNHHFEGRILPGCDEPRSYRTKGSITTQRYRIEAISQMTGVPSRRERGDAAKMKELAEAKGSDPEAMVNDESQEDDE